MNELLKKLAEKSGISDLSLERITRCDTLLGNPSRSFASVHVAGTNGKGTVTSKIAKALSISGYKTGHFLSPHIHTVCERIQINGVMIAPDDLDDVIETVLGVCPELTFFETLTAAAFLYFREQKVDFAVFEVGLGGTYDATNILCPKLSIITNISLDHQDLLGHTINEIAANKAGIIKRGIPVLIGYKAALPPVFARAKEQNAPLTILPPRETIDEENEQIAKAAIYQLQKQMRVDSCCTDVCLPARFEKVKHFDATYVFDMAHNEESILALISRLKKEYPYKNFSFVFNICRDKDLKETTDLVKKVSKNIYLYPLNYARATPVEELQPYFPGAVTSDFHQFIKEAKERGDVIVTTGSSMLIDPVKRELECVTRSKDPHLLYD